MSQSAVSRLRAAKSNTDTTHSEISQPSPSSAANGQTQKRPPPSLNSPASQPTKRRKVLSGRFELDYDFPTTPWRDESELALLRDSFFPQKSVIDAYSTPPPDSRNEAVEQVRKYETSHPRLVPHAMSATSLLSEAMAFEDQFHDKVSEGITRSVYSMAFTRFVTGFVDRDVKMGKLGVIAPEEDSGDDSSDDGRNGTPGDLDISEPEATKQHVTKYKAESSMYAYAARIGMPEHFVDLRHQTVHGQLSDTSFLRRCTEEALEWLWENWWKRHVRGDAAREKRRKWLQLVNSSIPSMEDS